MIKNDKITKLAQIAADILNTFNEELLDIQKYIKILNKIKRKIQKVDIETHPTHGDWKSLSIIFQDKIDYLEQQNIRPEFNVNENLEVIESAKTLVHLNFETLSEIKDLIRDATNLASKLSRNSYLDFHLPYDIIQQHMENISDILNHSLKRKKAEAPKNKLTDDYLGKERTKFIEKSENDWLRKQCNYLLEKLNNIYNLLSEFPENKLYFKSYIIDDLKKSIDEEIISYSNKNLIKTSENTNQILMQELISNKDVVDQIYNIYNKDISATLDNINKKFKELGIKKGHQNKDFFSAISNLNSYHRNVLTPAYNAPPATPVPPVPPAERTGIVPLNEAINQFDEFANKNYRTIEANPIIENLDSPSDPYNLLSVFGVLFTTVEHLKDSLEKTSAKKIFVKKYSQTTPTPSPDVKKQQIDLLKQFLIQFTNLTPHAAKLGNNLGVIFPQYVQEITKLITRLENEIKNKELFGKISPDVFNKSVEQIVNHINKYVPTIKQYKIEYTALEPNINTIIQTIHNYIKQQNVQWDEALVAKNNQNFSQMITKLENERQKVIKNAQRAKSLEDTYDMSISKLLLEESNFRLNLVSANDAIAGLKKTASLETIWRFLKGLFGQGVKDVDIQNFVDSQIINLNTKFDNFIKTLDIESEKNYNIIVSSLQGLKEHPLSKISFNLIPSQIRVEDASMSESPSSSGGGGRGASGGGGNANVIKVLQKYPSNMTNSEIQSRLSS